MYKHDLMPINVMAVKLGTDCLNFLLICGYQYCGTLDFTALALFCLALKNMTLKHILVLYWSFSTKPNHTNPYQSIPNHTQTIPIHTITNQTIPNSIQKLQARCQECPFSNCLLPVAYCPWPIANYKANYKLPNTNCQIQIANCQLLNDQNNISISSQFSYEFDSIELHSCYQSNLIINQL